MNHYPQRQDGKVPNEDLDNRFAYHPATESDIRDRHELVRSILRTAAGHIVDLTPAGREQSLAVTGLETAMMWANAAIAREPK